MNIADDNVREIFEKERPEIVYHFAFNVLVPKSVENPLIDMDSIAGSINLLKNSKDFNNLTLSPLKEIFENDI